MENQNVSLTNDEKSLLMYVETRCVDWQGRMSSARLNRTDMSILENWNQSGFITSGRIPKKAISYNGEGFPMTHWALMSDEAVTEAAALRLEKAHRGRSRLRQSMVDFEDSGCIRELLRLVPLGETNHES